MKFWNGKEITIRYIGRTPLQLAYKGARLIWQAVRSCFGSGIWIDEKPWIDDETWKDNK